MYDSIVLRRSNMDTIKKFIESARAAHIGYKPVFFDLNEAFARSVGKLFAEGRVCRRFPTILKNSFANFSPLTIRRLFYSPDFKPSSRSITTVCKRIAI